MHELRKAVERTSHLLNAPAKDEKVNGAMKRLIPVLVLGIFLFVLFPAQRVSAQQGDYPPLPSDAWKGQVSGKVVNQTTGKTVTEPVEVMLHAWDPDNQERMMVHAKTEPNGTFRFEGIGFHPDFSYSVMSTYLGATYSSETANVQQGENSFSLDAQVYDTTNDVSNLSVDQLHVLFYIEQGQLGVTQFYALSNSGKTTVKDAVTLPRERTGTLKFHLPEEAQNVQFGNDASGSRYVLLPDGFADTAPIPPGEGASQVVVGYNLPYSGKLAYTYTAPVAVKGVSFLVLENSGLSLEGQGLTPSGERSMDDGSTFKVYKAASLKAGESLQLTLSGQPGGEAQVGTALLPNSRNEGLAVGAGVLGLALVGAGVWWWRRRGDEETEEASEDTVEGILSEIEALEQAYQRGELPEDEYQESRTSLRNRLKAAVSTTQE